MSYKDYSDEWLICEWKDALEVTKKHLSSASHWLDVLKSRVRKLWNEIVSRGINRLYGLVCNI